MKDWTAALAALAIVALALYGLSLWGTTRECEAQGGTYVRGVILMVCVDAHAVKLKNIRS
jgi:hypothetical protein